MNKFFWLRQIPRSGTKIFAIFFVSALFFSFCSPILMAASETTKDECKPPAKKALCGECEAGKCDPPLECIGNVEGSPGQCQPEGQIVVCSLSSYQSVECLLNSITKWLLTFALIIAPLMIVLGGFYILTSRGDPKMTTTGKGIIKWAIIGLFVILFAKAFTSIIYSILQ